MVIYLARNELKMTMVGHIGLFNRGKWLPRSTLTSRLAYVASYIALLIETDYNLAGLKPGSSSVAPGEMLLGT